MVKDARPLGLSLLYTMSENKIGGLCVKSVGDGMIKVHRLGTPQQCARIRGSRWLRATGSCRWTIKTCRGIRTHAICKRPHSYQPQFARLSRKSSLKLQSNMVQTLAF